MKRLTNRKSRMGFSAKFYDKNGEVVQCIKKQSKKGFVILLKQEPPKEWHKIYIRVLYSANEWNDSDHYTLESALSALDKYTEKQLLDFIEK